MADETLPIEAENPGWDIFLSTRELPDELTAETSALRQLCGALLGDGYRVFFPPAVLAGKTPEEKTALTLAALRSAKVMVAAAVGNEGAADEQARTVWRIFRQLTREDPSRVFLPCLRDADQAPEELADLEILDMSDLQFLVKLKEKIAAALGPAPEAAVQEEAPAEEPAPEEPAPAEAPEAGPAPEEAPPEEAAPEEPAPEAAPEEEPAKEEPLPAPKRSRWPWIALAVAAVIIVGLLIALCLKIKTTG